MIKSERKFRFVGDVNHYEKRVYNNIKTIYFKLNSPIIHIAKKKIQLFIKQLHFYCLNN